MENKTEILERFSNLYTDNIERIESNSSAFINSLRKSAIARFMELGIPDKKNEAYRYTNLDTFFRHDYNNYFVPEAGDFAVAEDFKCDVQELDAYGFVLLNGFYPTVTDKLRQLPGGAWVGSIKEASKMFGDIIARHYGQYAKSETDGLIHLNSAMASDGVFVYVPKGVRIEKPVQVVNLVHSETDIFVQHRNLIVVEENAEISLIICDHTLSPHRSFLQMQLLKFMWEKVQDSILSEYRMNIIIHAS